MQHLEDVGSISGQHFLTNLVSGLVGNTVDQIDQVLLLSHYSSLLRHLPLETLLDVCPQPLYRVKLTAVRRQR